MMQVFLIFVLAFSTLILYFKWRNAVDAGIKSSQQGFVPEGLQATLNRIERKVDALALAQQDKSAVPASESMSKQAIPNQGSQSPVSKSDLIPVQEKVEALPAFASAGPNEVVRPEIPVNPSGAEVGPSPIPASLLPPVAPWKPIEMSAWEKEVRAILGKIWSWVLVGEEFRPKGVPLEFAMAGTWLMRVGVVVLVSCVVWFLKWSMVHGILGPSGRVGLSFAAGVGLTAWGYRMMGKRYQTMGQGLMGGGIAALYFAAYAAGPLYHLLPQIGCFAMMALITLSGCVLASGTKSQVTAILAMLGGYATPALLSTGVPNFPGLYSYMFLLGGGLLYLAIYRNWRLLHYLAFLAHWSLILGSLKDYQSAEHFAIVLPFLTAFFFQQHGVSIGYAFRRAVPISILEAVQQFLHAALFSGLAWKLISEAAGRPWPALLAIGMAVVFVIQTLAVLKRMPSDRLSVSVSLGLAGFFTAWSVPLLFNGSGLTVAWSLMALAWLWTGLRIRSQLLIIGSQILFLLAAIRLGSVDFPTAFMHGGSAESFGAYLQGFLHRLLNFGVFIGSLFIAARLYRNRADTVGSQDSSDPAGLRVSPEADLPISMPIRQAGLIAFLLGYLILFITVHFEAMRFLGFHPPIQSPGIILIWTAFAAYLIRHLQASAWPVLPWVVGGVIGLVGLRMIGFDWVAMGLENASLRFDEAGLQLVYRGFAHAGILSLIWSLGTGRFGLRMAEDIARGYRIAAVVLLFMVVSLETRTVSGVFLPSFQSGALSVVWALFAMALVGMGLKFNERMARFSGLILFGVVAIKVFLFDLSSLEMIWRVLSFLAVGTVLLLGSFAYLRASRPNSSSEEVKE